MGCYTRQRGRQEGEDGGSGRPDRSRHCKGRSDVAIQGGPNHAGGPGSPRRKRLATTARQREGRYENAIGVSADRHHQRPSDNAAIQAGPRLISGCRWVEALVGPGASTRFVCRWSPVPRGACGCGQGCDKPRTLPDLDAGVPSKPCLGCNQGSVVRPRVATGRADHLVPGIYHQHAVVGGHWFHLNSCCICN